MTSAIPSYGAKQEETFSSYTRFQKKRDEISSPRSDWWLIVIVAALIMLGLLMVM